MAAPRRSIGVPMTQLCRLLALVAVLLMPFGMTAAAEASSAAHHEMAGMPMGHCPDQGSQPESKAGIAACTMICSAALPAIEPARSDRDRVEQLPAEACIVHALAGLHPDSADPPPKRA